MTNDILRIISRIANSQDGIEFVDVDFQVANGGGAPTSPEGVNPDGSKAGVVL